MNSLVIFLWRVVPALVRLENYRYVMSLSLTRLHNKHNNTQKPSPLSSFRLFFVPLFPARVACSVRILRRRIGDGRIDESTSIPWLRLSRQQLGDVGVADDALLELYDVQNE
jgi:hypothetical protein